MSRLLTHNDIIAGEIAVDVLSAFTWPDTAAQLHAGVMQELVRQGFDVFPEFRTGHLGDERNGRIDVVASFLGGLVAIELDARRPRRRSLLKLRLFNGYRIVGLRGVQMDPPEGIDAVVPISVHVASIAQRRDKRTVSKVAA